MGHRRTPVILAAVLFAAAVVAGVPASAGSPLHPPQDHNTTIRKDAQPTPANTNTYVEGSFEMKIFFDAVTGFQRFSRDPVTEIAYDGSNGGVLGEYLPGSTSGWVPSPGEEIYATFVPKVEIDMIKRINDVARLRADISFGRPQSGSFVVGHALNHAYAAVKLSQNYNMELLIGRFGGQAGYEPFRAYHNDTVSWSIMWRGNLYPPGMTGMQLSADLTNTLSAFFIVSNGNINDADALVGTLPSFQASLVWTWGPEAQPDTFVFTPYFGPESGNNRPFTYGADVTFVHWLTRRLKLGLEACYQRDNMVLGSPAPASDTDYASGLVNLRWDITPSWYGVLKYVYARQVGEGNGVLDLTGADQSIHESSIGVGYQLNDSSKFKGEFRFDVIDPETGPTQTIPGAAFEYAWFF